MWEEDIPVISDKQKYCSNLATITAKVWKIKTVVMFRLKCGQVLFGARKHSTTALLWPEKRKKTNTQLQKYVM